MTSPIKLEGYKVCDGFQLAPRVPPDCVTHGITDTVLGFLLGTKLKFELADIRLKQSRASLAK